MTRAQVRRPADVRYVWDGQSHNLWPPVSLGGGTPYGDGLGPVPNRVMAGSGIPFANVAIINAGWADLATTAATRLFPQARNRAGCTDTLIMFGGQSDIYLGASGATTYARAVTYANNARATGFGSIIGITSPPFDPNKNGGFATEIAAYNAALVADASSAFDLVFDMHIPPLDVPGPPYYESDWVHMNPLGARTCADILKPLFGL